MNREKEKKVLTVYALTILACLLVLIGVKVWEESPAGNFFEACEDMDRIEPRYDADGYFIMVSTKDALVGTGWHWLALVGTGWHWLAPIGAIRH